MSRVRPVGAAEFASFMAAFAPFEPRPHVAVAVSGGRDSMALAFLTARWVRKLGGRATALVVDHALRVGSAEEARRARSRLKRRGIDAQVLTRSGPKPEGDLLAFARAARYALLEEWCRRACVLHLLLAHHEGDQGETLLLRLGRGSGLYGLAAMPAVVERDAVRLLRPLLPVPRERLTATLAAARLGYDDDPSNLNVQHARARLRAALPALGEDGLFVRRLARTASELGRARAALDGALSDLAAQSASVDPTGTLHLAAEVIARAPAELRLRLLASALATVAGAEFPPRARDVEGLWRDLASGRGTARTVGGCVVRKVGNSVLIGREPSAVREVLLLSPGRTVVWDGRFSVRAGSELPAGLTLAKLGASPLKEARIGYSAQGLRSVPAIWKGSRLVAVPQIGWAQGKIGERALHALRVEFSPLRPLAPTPFGIV